MEIQLLGPVQAWHEGTQVDLGSPRQRLAFAVLAANAGRPVQQQTLIDRLWDDGLPLRARDTLYVYIARLRSAGQASDPDVPAFRVQRRSGGYLLEVEPLQVDMHRFDRLIARARETADDDRARAALLHQALRLWQAEPLADITGSWVEEVRQGLWAKHVDTATQWAEIELRLDNANAVIGPVTEILRHHPYSEPLAAVLMQALADSGRGAQALALYAQIQARLADELGADPSPELQRIHQAILRGQRRPHRDEPAASPVCVPAQLPRDIHGFIGRDREFRRLSELRDVERSGVAVVAGTAGVGKTAFAVRWGHANASLYPDGQLFLNLRGFEPGVPPMSPREALGRLLRDLGTQPGSIPRDLDEAAALYRSMMSGRRILLLLDNVSDVQQVRPLLPGTATCMVLVTSRLRLGGLLAREGALLITLKPLKSQQAQELLEAMLGPRRAAGSPETAELARRCAFLPLALRIASANLACQPQLSISAYLGQLAQRGPLEALRADGDRSSAVAAAFDMSYAVLRPEAQRLFRLWILCAGHDFDGYAAAALMGSPLRDVTGVLDGLCAAHLLTQDGDGRYSTHDLLRAYARGRMRADEPVGAVGEVARRLVDFYTDTAFAASPLFLPRRDPTERDIVYPPLAKLRFQDRESAMRWHDLERDNLVGVVELAARNGWHRAAWQLAECLYPYFFVSRRWEPWLAVTSAGAGSAAILGDPEAIATMQLLLGVIHKQTGDYAEAGLSWHRALREARDAGHDRLVMACHINLGGLRVNEGDPLTAISHLRAALDITSFSGDPKYATILYVNYGCALLDLDDPAQAAEAFGMARIMAEQAQDLVHLCNAHHNLAEVALRRDDLVLAHEHAQAQVRAAKQASDPLRLAAAWEMLGSAVCAIDPALAGEHWRLALALYRQLNHRLAEPLARWIESAADMDPRSLRTADDERRRQARKMI